MGIPVYPWYFHNKNPQKSPVSPMRWSLVAGTGIHQVTVPAILFAQQADSPVFCEKNQIRVEKAWRLAWKILRICWLIFICVSDCLDGPNSQGFCFQDVFGIGVSTSWDFNTENQAYQACKKTYKIESKESWKKVKTMSSPLVLSFWSHSIVVTFPDKKQTELTFVHPKYVYCVLILIRPGLRHISVNPSELIFMISYWIIHNLPRKVCCSIIDLVPRSILIYISMIIKDKLWFSMIIYVM